MDYTKKRAPAWLVINILLLCTVLPVPVGAQEALGAVSVTAPSVSFANPTSPQDKLQALSLTRFHFIALKQFHSNLFSKGEADQSITREEARLLNVGLNAFLLSADRERLVLEALRQNKAIHFRFTVPEQPGNGYQVVNHPTKELVYRLKPVVTQSTAVIEIRPLFDGPIAFQITLEKGNERADYEVNWAGWISGFPWAR